MDYFVANGYLEDLENTVTVDALHGDISIMDSVSTSNLTSCNSDFVFTESYLAATTHLYSSNLVSSNIQTNLLKANSATLTNITFTGALRSNLVLADMSAGEGDFYNVQTSTLTCNSNLAASIVLSSYVDATMILGSNIYLLHELIDRSNVSIIDSNRKIDWVRLKNLPENNEGSSPLS
jgi:hypothetical protein